MSRLSMGPVLKLNVVRLNVGNTFASGYRVSLSSLFPYVLLVVPVVATCNEILSPFCYLT